MIESEQRLSYICHAQAESAACAVWSLVPHLMFLVSSVFLATANINFGIMLCLGDADDSSMDFVHLCAVLRFLEGFSTIAEGRRTVTGPS